MNLKTFRGNSMAQALAEVKKGLGQDAVILHTRTYRVGAVFGMGGKNVVEITASDQAAARDQKRQARRATNPYGSTVPATSAPASPLAGDPARVTAPLNIPRVAPRQLNTRPGTATNAATNPAASATGSALPIDPLSARATAARDSFTPSIFDAVRTATSDGASPASSPSPSAPIATSGPSLALRSMPSSSVEPTKAPGSTSSMSRLVGSPARLAPVDDLALATLQDELSSIKKLVGQVLQCSRKTAATLVPSETEHQPSTADKQHQPKLGVLNLGGMSDPLFSLYLAMTEGGVSAELAESLAGKVRDELTPAELADEIVVGRCMLRHVADVVRVVGSLPRLGLQPDARPLTIALIGPTGVGKTTTIAKLAATFKLRHQKNVGLITADTYRIAAVEQLRTYADIIGLPLKVVNTPDEVAAAIHSLGDCDVILLDTAGRSQHDRSRLTELSEIVAAANPHETHLVLSATVAEGVMKRTADRFSAISPSRVIFTKLDEAVAFGCVANIAASTRLPISFITTGQEVPDQIELADAERLARLILQRPSSTDPDADPDASPLSRGAGA